ncbi:hypothetical protein [Priestia koreensis]|nr:hypothetical protein [Priestia koreensis]
MLLFKQITNFIPNQLKGANGQKKMSREKEHYSTLVNHDEKLV